MNKSIAYNHTCKKCGKLHHHENVCRLMSQRRWSTPPTNNTPPDDATTVFYALCSVGDATESTLNTISLEHHVYNDFCDTWEKRQSDPQPFIDVSIQVIPSDFKHLSLPTSISHPTSTISYRAMANMGCQSCLAGSKMIHELGLNKHHLTPVTMKMTAADNHGINIIGALVLRITGTSPSGATISTR
ncbi:hypothetical protein Pcinc_009187 [Petrolisthes cinctipes]|uniref:Uncharacterized protein n=1 Tax=Petrolisthes cinctipes TaxID=88211 RepID=A0AAE1FWG4_PETCI|nr:hypothetical protein Pcinc_013687 [Petrolisthes cinctipes]KAK3886670.1 hypothetical protein Pcinc_009187 [Petrolisthes cinctipes]